MPQTQSYEPSTLRIEPHMIPALRASFADALAHLQAHLTKMDEGGRLPGAWLGDNDSQKLADHYESWVLRGEGGPLSAAKAYAQRLSDVHQQLHAAEVAYRQTEGDNAAMWGRA